jgi:hypothetical protein
MSSYLKHVLLSVSTTHTHTHTHTNIRICEGGVGGTHIRICEEGLRGQGTSEVSGEQLLIDVPISQLTMCHTNTNDDWGWRTLNPKP